MHRTLRTPISLGLMVLFQAGLIMGAVPAEGATYYLSQSTGDDSADGLAPEQDGTHGPWRSLAKASSVGYQPGDRVLLKCVDTWNETLTLRGSGEKGRPVVLGSYGTGERPYIRRALGEGAACVVIEKGSGFQISDLELGFAHNAIRILADSRANSILDGYVIEGCFFHDIANTAFPSSIKRERFSHNDLRHMGWALFCDGFDSPAGVLLANLTVRNCISFRNQGFFIQMGHVGLEKIVFEGNTVAHNSYNSLYQAGAKQFDIKNSVFVYGYPWDYHPLGATQVLAGGVQGDAVIRNEVIGNEFGWAGEYPGCPDGCAYDFEGATSGVAFQNNFIHNTYGESVLFMGGFEHKDLLFDNNLFLNNVRFSPRWDIEVTVSLSNTGNGTFSNNTFFSRKGVRAFGGKPDCFTFTNNDEDAAGSFVEMPLVTNIELGSDSRTYSLATSTPGAAIRYTRDGSLPTPSSPLYTEPLTVWRSGIINAKAFKKGAYPSRVNVLVADLRSQEGGAPILTWSGSGGGRDREFDGTQTAVPLDREAIRSVADTFTIAFWAQPEAERLSTVETSSGMGVSKAAWLKLDEESGADVMDSIGNTGGRAAGCTRTEGKWGKGLRFNGKDDSVIMNSMGLRAVSDNFTLAFWADAEGARALTPEATAGISGTSNQRLALAALQFSESSGKAGVGVSAGTNGISVFEHAVNHLPSPLVAELDLAGWNHIALVFRDNQPSLYINGKHTRTGLKSTKHLYPVFNLGGMEYGWFQGALDDIRVYPRVLSDAEVAQLAAGDPEGKIAWTVQGDDEEASRFALAPIARGDGPGAGHAGVGVSVGTNGVSVFEASDEYQPSLLVDDIPLSGWNHITVVYQDKQPTLYLNGVYEKAGCKSAKTVHPVFDLGGSHRDAYIGKMDAVCVYDRVLADAEIQVLAAKKPAGVQ